MAESCDLGLLMLFKWKSATLTQLEIATELDFSFLCSCFNVEAFLNQQMAEAY